MNPPYDVQLLDRIDRAIYARPKKSADRDRLQKLGLIETRRPAQIETNRSAYWQATHKGRLEAETNRKEGLV